MSNAAFQSSVRLVQGFGVVGELFSDAPLRAQPFQLQTTCVVGRMCTSDTQGEASQGGSDVKAGILFNPKVYALMGDGSDALNPSLTVAAYTNVELLKQGELIVSLPADCDIGDPIQYATATGILSAYKAEAQFTASQSTTVLTVTAVAQGRIGVGTVVYNASNEVIGTIISLGTGTGGTGTYNMNTSATVGSGALHSAGVPSAGNVDANGVVTRYTPDAGTAQLAVVSFNIP